VFVVVAQFTAIRQQWAPLLGASLLYTFALLVVALVVTRLAGLDHSDRWALVWGFPARNLAVAALIATAVVGQLAMATFGAVLFAVHLATMIPLALWIGRNSGRRKGVTRRQEVESYSRL
jgi:predicted Na+-dependent transporter